jgi:hypothetical protein
MTVKTRIRNATAGKDEVTTTIYWTIAPTLLSHA